MVLFLSCFRFFCITTIESNRNCSQSYHDILLAQSKWKELLMYLSLEKLYLRGEVAVLTLIVNEAVKRVSMYNIY